MHVTCIIVFTTRNPGSLSETSVLLFLQDTVTDLNVYKATPEELVSILPAVPGTVTVEKYYHLPYKIVMANLPEDQFSSPSASHSFGDILCCF